ncbi:MAG: SDR family NAD(P)-dependent oxidoreductase [Xanthobacteraceae bacterium]
MFHDKLVVITGGSSGIGFALAQALLRQGAKVILLADRVDRLEAAVLALGGRSQNLDAYALDIANPDLVAVQGALITERHGAPDILINNAGFAIYKTFHRQVLEDVKRLIAVNFGGAMYVTKAFLDGMIERRTGHIVNVASVGGSIHPFTPDAIYGGCKHGMIAWSRNLRSEVSRFGISITVVCPGRVQTRFFDHPSFQKRRHRKETEITVPIEKVVDSTLNAVRRGKFMCHVPGYWGIIAWAVNALGPFARFPLERLMRARVEDLYEGEKSQ